MSSGPDVNALTKCINLVIETHATMKLMSMFCETQNFVEIAATMFELKVWASDR